MKRYYPAWCVVAAVVVFAPVGLRMLSWERAKPRPVDVSMAKAGEVLFVHEWQNKDALSPNGDGLGPVFNARSCVACHNQGGVGGGGGLDHNVTTFVIQQGNSKREGVIHAEATEPRYQETLALLDPSLPAVSKVSLKQIVPNANGAVNFNDFLAVPPHIQLSQRQTPALFGAKLIDEIPDRVLLAQERTQRLKHGMASAISEKVPVGRALRLADGRIGHFGWKAQTSNLSAFVQGACANELGLGNPGQAQPVSMADASYRPKGLDLTQQQCDQLTAFISGLDRPTERVPEEPKEKSQSHAGKNLFGKIGCADCHTPDMGSVEGIYSDLLLHRMGQELQGGGSGYEGTPRPSKPSEDPDSGPLTDEWRTPPLWGVADSAPYMHDGRAATLPDAIAAHGGQGAASASRFANLRMEQQKQLLAFLQSLRAPGKE